MIRPGRTRGVVIIILMIMGSGSAAACSSDTTTTTDGPLVAEGSGAWANLPMALPTGAAPPPAVIAVGRVRWTGDHLTAVGTIDHQFAAWTSSDGQQWSQPWIDAAGDIVTTLSSLVEWQGRLVASGAGSPAVDTPSGHRAPKYTSDTYGSGAVWVSDDRGADWRRVARDPSVFGRADVTVETTTHGLIGLQSSPVHPSSGPSRAAIYTSSDGESWNRVADTDELFGGDSEVHHAVDLNGTILVSGQRDFHPSMWLSHDNVNWERFEPGGVDVPSPQIAVVNSTVVAFGVGRAGASASPSDPPTPVVWTSTDGRSWTGIDRDAGVFGDGNSFLQGVLGAWGPGLAISTWIMERDNPQFCFQDVKTCEHRSHVVAVTDDGTHWRRVQLDDDQTAETGSTVEFVPTQRGAAIHTRYSAPNSKARSGDQLLAWTPVDVGRPFPPTVASPAPTTTTPAFPMIGRDRKAGTGHLEVGSPRRMELAYGACAGSGLEINGREWVMRENHVPNPVPDDWLFRPVEEADGPSGYLYVTANLVDADRLELSVEGHGVVLVFTPGQPDDQHCA